VRILLVNAHGADLAYGGAERYVHDLREGLTADGDSVTVLSAFPVRADRSEDLRVLHATDWRDDRVRRYRNHIDDWVTPVDGDVDAILADVAPDLVHTSNVFGITTGVWECARRRGIPVVHTLHDYQLLCPRTTLLRRDGTPCRPNPLLCGLRTQRLRRWAPGVNTFIGVSQHVLAAHRDFLAPSAGHEVILPPLVATALCSQQRAPGPVLATIGYLGALDAHKGIEMLLDAGRGLQALGIRLRVAGGGPMQDAVAAEPSIDYAGRLIGPEVARFIDACDIGVVPSLWEEPGLTFAALEWLGGGRPVLATSRGGLAELGGGGVVTLSGSSEDLLARVAELLDETAWARLLATVPEVDGDRDADRWLQAHRDVYVRALASTPTGSTV
jgi:glycosyltransferase involved in cell wall biosynthesis